MLGDLAVWRKAVTSQAVTQADAFQWIVVFISKVGFSVPHDAQDPTEL